MDFDDPARGWAAVAASLDAYGLRGREAAALRGDIQALRRLYALQKKERGRARVARNGPRPHPSRLYGRPWQTDLRSSGSCPICHVALPHRTFAERKAHNWQVIRVYKGCAKQWRRLRADPAYAKWVASFGHRTQSARALAARIAIFHEMAPHAATVLGAEGVRQIVARRPYGKHTELRQWVRVHYGTGRLKWGALTKP